MMHGFQQIVTQAERCDNFVVHGLPPLGDEMGVSPLIWRKKLMDSISGNLGYHYQCTCPPQSAARRLPTPAHGHYPWHHHWRPETGPATGCRPSCRASLVAR